MQGATFGALYAVDLADGSRLVAKTATGPGSMLATEGWMLRWLKAHSALPVPEAVHADDTLLLMTYVEAGDRIDDAAEIHAAELIAALHGIRGEAFGFERGTAIGPLTQPNGWEASWVAFLRDRRLMHMGRAAQDAGRLPKETFDRLERFCARLGDFVPEPAQPSLLHGDLWTGNVLCRGGKIAAFVDPALYFGNPEMDLAFSTLFGTFGEAFFARYGEIQPLEPGFFETTRDICNLWPLLVHARLFGGSYAGQADAILRRFA
jgi:fructosamine-3-kinase